MFLLNHTALLLCLLFALDVSQTPFAFVIVLVLSKVLFIKIHARTSRRVGAYNLLSINTLRRKGLVYKTNITMPSKDRMRRDKRKDINKCYEINKDVILSESKEKYKHLLAPLKSTKTSIIKKFEISNLSRDQECTNKLLLNVILI